MSEDLVKASEVVGRLCDRIEQLERELAAEVENNKGEFESRTEAERKVRVLTGQLAAEEALADRLARGALDLDAGLGSVNIKGALAAYRKARGL